MVETLNDILLAKGYRIIATFDRSELFQRVASEIPGLSEMDYFILPIDIALSEKSIGESYEGFHYIYARKS